MSEFIDDYNEEAKKARTYREAYEEAERRHKEKTGKRKYSNYDSFRHVKNRKLKKK